MLPRTRLRATTQGGSRPAGNPLQAAHREEWQPLWRQALLARRALQVAFEPNLHREISHKGARHPGQHEAIIERELFEHIQTLLRERAVRRKIRTNKVASSPLAGKLLDESGESLTPSHAVKGERRYRYYVSRNLIAGTADPAKRGWRVPAPELERTLAAAVCQILSDQPSLAAAAQAIGLAENQPSSRSRRPPDTASNP